MDKKELLKKVKRLAERGSIGEKEAAIQTLEKLMKKYNIKEDDLTDESMELFQFEYSDYIEKRLMVQAIYMVIGKDAEPYAREKSDKKIFLNCTNAQHMEIKTAFYFYNDRLKKDIDLLYEAFIHRNHIFPKNAEGISSEYSKEELNKIRYFGKGIKKYSLFKAISSEKYK